MKITTFLVFILLAAAQIMALPAPNLISPADGITGSPRTTTITWNRVPGATYYIVWACTTSNCAEGAMSLAWIGDTSATVTFERYDKIYYWHVEANDGSTSASSATRSLTVAVATPQPQSPSNLATFCTLTPRLQWNTMAAGTLYQVQVSTDTNFAGLIANVKDILSYYDLDSLAPATTRYWRVRASRSDSSNTSAWSARFQFTTAPLPPIPVLTTPAHLAANLPLSPTLAWTASDTAYSFDLQVATDMWTEAGMAWDEVGITEKSKTISGLAYNTTYYWRVRSNNPAGTSGWTYPGPQQMFFSTIPAPTPAPALISPANGANGISGSPTLLWHKMTGAVSYTVQACTTVAFDASTIEYAGLTDTLKAFPGLLTDKNYFWRVNSTNAGGTGPWSPPWNFATVPPAPVLLAPAQNAIGIMAYPAFEWNSVSGASAYALQVSATSDFSDLVVDIAQTDTLWQSSTRLTNGQTYYWRVKASVTVGFTDWSQAGQFTTLPLGSDVPIPTVPALYASDVVRTTQFEWYEVSGAEKYYIQVSTTANFASPIVNDSTADYYYYRSTPFAANTLLYWRVYARSAGGNSAWSDTMRFTTAAEIPPVPTPLFPASSATGVATDITFRWNKATGATSYELHACGGNCYVVEGHYYAWTIAPSGLTDTFYTVTGLDANTVHKWEVVATNGSGSDTCAVMTFTTGAPVPVLASPSNNSFAQPSALSLSWLAASSATGYALQVSTSPSFSSDTLVDTADLTGLSYPLSGLASYTTYYWRAAGIFTGVQGPWSSAWSFQTVPGAPTLISPADGAGIAALPGITFSWSAVSGGSNYQIQISPSNTFSEGNTEFIVNDASVTTSQLLSNTLYFWRVRASDYRSVDGPWSSTSHFTTTPAAPPAPSLASPAHNSSGVSTGCTFSWTAAATAETYTFEISTSSSFSSGNFTTTGITTTSTLSPEIVSGTTYYWHVQAVNATGPSPWSSTWRMTTIPEAASMPALISPASGAADVPTSPTLSWAVVSGALDYTVELSDMDDFSLLIESATLSAPDYGVSGLVNEQKYFWRVRSNNAGGNSAWAVDSFTTLPLPPAPPIRIFPLDGASGVPLAPTLTWNLLATALTYDIDISRSPAFPADAESTISLRGQADTTVPMAGLDSGTVYFWRVRASNTGGTGPWNAAWSCTTITTLPLPPALISPLHAATVLADSAVLAWSRGLPNVLRYRLEVATDSLMTDIISTDTALTDTTAVLKALADKSTRWWRVSARNATGWGLFSETRKFTVDLDGTAVEALALPARFGLVFTGMTSSGASIRYAMPVAAEVSLKLYNIQGRLVRTIRDSRDAAGYHHAQIDLRPFAKGCYVMDFRAGKFTSRKRIFNF